MTVSAAAAAIADLPLAINERALPPTALRPAILAHLSIAVAEHVLWYVFVFARVILCAQIARVILKGLLQTKKTRA
jgi:hypothetical protein